MNQSTAAGGGDVTVTRALTSRDVRDISSSWKPLLQSSGRRCLMSPFERLNVRFHATSAGLALSAVKVKRDGAQRTEIDADGREAGGCCCSKFGTFRSDGATMSIDTDRQTLISSVMHVCQHYCCVSAM